MMAFGDAKQFLYKRLAVRGPVTVGERFHVGPGSRVWAPAGLVLGDDVYIGKWCTIEVDGAIGDGTLIANNVGLVGRRDHDMRQSGVRMSRATWVGDADGAHLRTSVSIGRDVWLGYGSIILAPISIGERAVVAAGSVVVDDVPANAIVRGNPAIQVGERPVGASRMGTAHGRPRTHGWRPQ